MDRYEDGCYGSFKGIALIGKVLAGRCKMHYTRIAVGKGHIPDGVNPKALTEPPEYVMDAQISGVTNPVDGECQVSAQINSKNVEKGFYATGLLLYAQDPDEGEVPYTYLNLEGDPEWIRPSSSIVGKLAFFDLIAAVGDVDMVYASIDPEALVTAGELAAALQRSNSELLVQVTAMLAGASSMCTVDLVVPKEGWGKVTGENEPEGLYVDIQKEEIQADMVPVLTLLPASSDTAKACGFAPTTRTVEGALRVYAKRTPEKSMDASLMLIRTSGSMGGGAYVLPPATPDTLGGVRVGPGLNVTKDGVLSVDTASEGEVDELLSEVFPPDDRGSEEKD